MPFILPTFNLMCNVWHDGADAPLDPPSATFACNLSRGRRVTTPVTTDFSTPAAYIVMQLLLPKGTDIRDSSGGTEADQVEVPAGSGRYYVALQVDDTAKGFANEYRYAILLKDNTIPWPLPIP